MSSVQEKTGQIGIRYALERGEFSLDVDVELSMQGISGIFGPSGAGKTTLLRCIAGLEQATSGRLIVDGDVVEDSDKGVSRPVHRRAIGYVFQEPRLFPHLNVERNLTFGLERAGSAGDVDFDQVVALLGIESLLPRKPAGLSGGEAQRVAIARSLLCAPRFILMDEPVAALDASRRYEVLPFVERLHSELSIPVIYVSHNIDEICLLCDQLLVMDHGRVFVHGDLQDVLTHTEIPVLGGDEAGSVIRGKVLFYDAEFDLSRVAVSGGELWITGRHEPDSFLRVRIRASDVSLCRETPSLTSIQNRLSVDVDSIDEESAHSVLVRLRCGDDRFQSRITRRSCKELGLERGEKLIAQIKSVSVRRASL